MTARQSVEKFIKAAGGDKSVTKRPGFMMLVARDAGVSRQAVQQFLKKAGYETHGKVAMVFERKCVDCGDVRRFVSRRVDSMRCRSCAAKLSAMKRSNQPGQICFYCGKEFMYKAGVWNVRKRTPGLKHTFCSQKHYLAWRRDPRFEKINAS